ncbi:hypothetical protein J5N97_005862 [Dioscorea zingiberensis]|uniref:Glycine-rich domain-containing protein 1 n=1 Tax=Dioscorea zingiberensis TaxID=325984 RepID=A0A9D5D989_9LILI|nr:hypothetical protein J5N97_005862 [Dioscorea zingiberensis]
MDRDQELEWLAAQKITISEDLVAAAKQQLAFLSAVDRRRFLYAGPIVDRAIHRYKTCWLPLLAKFTESGSNGSPLVVPLDCEWIWHCHRLNPVQYKKDCEKLFGRILDNKNVKSSLQVQGDSKDQTVQLWTKLFPEEPFEFDLTTAPAEEFTDHEDSQDGLKGIITYDLVAAVGRQSTFYYQICSATMHDDRYLKEALARYKAFLYLIKRNKQKASVPTFDIDLMWHSHQLQPVSYCKDMLELLGKLLEHDEIVTGASREIKLENGFSETTKQWEYLYGLRYWREGAIFKGSDSSPLVSPYRPNLEIGHRPKVRQNSKILNLVQMQLVEVLLEIVGISNLPTRRKGNLFVAFRKQQYDFFFSGHSTLNIFSETGEKHVAAFQCEAKGDLVLTLVSNSSRKSARAEEVIGTTSISIDELVSSKSKLFLQEWVELSKCQSHSGDKDTKPVSILVAASVSVPAPSPFIFYVVKGSTLSKNACFLSHPGTIQNDYWTHFVHANGDEVISLKIIRNSSEEMSEDYLTNKRQVIGTTKFNRKLRVLAEYERNAWSLRDPNFALRLERKTGLAGDVLEIKGDAQIKLYLGRSLEYEPKSNNMRIDKDLVTIVEFSADYPYGRALAMFGLKSGILKVNESWFVLPAVLMSFIISDYFESEGYGASHLIEGAPMENFKTSTLADESETTSIKGSLPKWRTTLSYIFSGNGAKAFCLASPAPADAKCAAKAKNKPAVPTSVSSRALAKVSPAF